MLELPSVTDSYQELVTRHYGFAYSVALRLLDSTQDAEEVAQDAMLQVFHKLSTFGARSSFRTWLYVIVRNAAKNRTAKNISRRRAEEAHVEMAAAEVELFPSPHDQTDHIQAALRKLDADQREIIVMRYLSGLSLEEIAETMKIGLSAAKMRLYRAMDSFKAAWESSERVIIPFKPDSPK